MQARRAIDFALAHRREAAYHLAFATAVSVLWLHAWTLSVSTMPCSMSPDPSSPAIGQDPPRTAIAIVSDGN